MANVLGYISFASIVILAAKFITRRAGNDKADAFFWKLHKPASGIFLLACIVHVLVQIPVLYAKSMQMIVLGVCGAGCAVILIGACHMIKEEKQKMQIHRALTVILVGIAVVHLFCGNR